MKITGNVRLAPLANDQLRDLSVVRKGNHAQARTNQDIVADLIAKAHKKECK